MLAEFRLKRIVDGLPHRAEVAVEVRRAAEDAVRIGDDPYGWRRDVYGPGAWIGGPEDEGTVAAWAAARPAMPGESRTDVPSLAVPGLAPRLFRHRLVHLFAWLM